MRTDPAPSSRPQLAPVDFDAPPEHPAVLVRTWLAEAETTTLPNPNAMTLATIDPDGKPSARIVLLRGFDERGATFFTNRQSRKGEGLEVNRRAAILFHWDPLDRQIRIEGEVSHASDAESDAYFAGRARESQINAWASAQSRPIASRAALLELQELMRARFEGGPVPRPPHWGGYRVSLEHLEFWQGDAFRLHDRVLYTRSGAGWRIQRLCP